jgi:histidinol dehydrogenase
MSLVERLDRCKMQLDRQVQESVVEQAYLLVEADLRDLIDDAAKRIRELENERTKSPDRRV